MRVSRERQTVLSLKVTAGLRKAVVVMAAQETQQHGVRCTLTDIVEHAIRRLAKAKGVKVE